MPNLIESVSWHRLAHEARSAEPNAAHLALARWERILLARPEPGWLKVVTQNVDGLHARAGSRDVLEVHGSILRAKRLGKVETFEYETTPDDPRAPEAPNGSRRTRPDVVLFGERPRRMREATQAVFDADLVVFAGTSGRVWPVAGLLEVANESQTPALLLNQEEWDHGEFQIAVLDDVLALDELVPQEPTEEVA
ncbi:MAG: Sir2 family NAD-dependent protein deacetylase [Kocuria sp.]|nr:Sir2 family NAD-dependent protein deacetylase [Kocuria sp.]